MTKYDDGGLSFNVGERTLYFSKGDLDRFEKLGFTIKQSDNKYFIYPYNINEINQVLYKATQEGFKIDLNTEIIDWKPKASCANYERDNVELGTEEYKPYEIKKVSPVEMFNEDKPNIHLILQENKLFDRDPIVQKSKEFLQRRSNVGVNKYERFLSDAKDEDFIYHAMCEAGDLLNYLMTLHEQKKILHKLLKVSQMIQVLVKK